MFNDSYFKLNVESTTIINAPPHVRGFAFGSATVMVTDGRLTVSNVSGAVNNKINYIRIKQR